jgi:hypothetical protein
MRTNWTRLALILGLLACLTSCADCLRPAEQIPLRLDAPGHRELTVIQVTQDGARPMAQSEGVYVLDLPMSGYGRVYLFGDVSVKHNNPEKQEYVVVKENGVVLKKVSVARVRSLPKDERGTYTLRVK